MTQPETLPLSQDCLERLTKKLALFFAPHGDEDPSAQKPRRICPEVAQNLKIEIEVVEPSKSSTHPSARTNEKCLTELEARMADFRNKHSISENAIATFPSKQCLDELVKVFSEFYQENNIPPETVCSLQVHLKYYSPTQPNEVISFTMACRPGGPPYAPCPFGQTWTLI